MIRRLFCLSALLCALGAVTGCGPDEVEPCGIRDNGDGTSTLRCGGETYVIPGGSTASDCTLVRGEDGAGTITCADGTFVRIGDDGRPVFPGTGRISGRATLFGLSDHEGITVRAPGTGFSTTTDVSGAFVFRDLPTGIYSLVFERRGRVPQRIDNIPVLPGEIKLDQVTLMLGQQISPLPLSSLEIGESPRHDAFFVHVTEVAESGRLTIWELESLQGTVLSATASQPSFASDGRHLVFLEDRSSDGKVILWDVDGREAVQLADGARACTFTPDGRMVAIAGDDLRLVDIASRETFTLPAAEPEAKVWYAPDGRSVVYLSKEDELVSWSADDRRGTKIRAPSSPLDVRFTPDGRDAVIVDSAPVGSIVLRWDVDTSTSTEWATSEGPVEFLLLPTDRYVAFTATDVSLRNVYFWARGEERPRVLTDRDLVASVLDDGAVLWMSWAVSPSLSLYEVATGNTRVLATNVGWAVPSPDGQSVLVGSNAGGERSVIRLVGRKEFDVTEFSEFGWSTNGAWLQMSTGDFDLMLMRASTGRKVQVGAPVRPLSFTDSGTGLFFQTWDPEEPAETVRMVLWDLEAERANVLGPFRSPPQASRSGRTVFIAESRPEGTPLWQIDPRRGDIVPIDMDASMPTLFERFLIYEPPEKGTWMVTGYE
ncbi:MAG TPA: hypothetical protein VGD74_03335 [Vulgatibacter sp.]